MGQQTFSFQFPSTAVTTTSVAVTAVNNSFTLTPSVGSDGGSMRVVNIGTQTIYLAYGSVTASVATSMPILANTVETFSLPGAVNTLSVIAAATGSTIYVTTGIGQ